MKISKGLVIIIISAVLVGIVRFFGYHHPLMFWFIGIAAMGIAVKVDGDIPYTYEQDQIKQGDECND